MTENEFHDSGIDYVSVDAKSTLNDCMGCAYYILSCCEAGDIPPCKATARKDNRNVIFIEKQGE